MTNDSTHANARRFHDAHVILGTSMLTIRMRRSGIRNRHPPLNRQKERRVHPSPSDSYLPTKTKHAQELPEVHPSPSDSYLPTLSRTTPCALYVCQKYPQSEIRNPQLPPPLEPSK
jgi:hypothetical protein